MPFRSAYGCCSLCGHVVSCRAATEEEAVGLKPYRHKWWYGTAEGLRSGGWCEGHCHDALHFMESPDLDAIERILQAQRESKRNM